MIQEREPTPIERQEFDITRCMELENALQALRVLQTLSIGADSKTNFQYSYDKDGVRTVMLSTPLSDFMKGTSKISFRLYMDLCDSGQKEMADYVMQQWRKRG